MTYSRNRPKELRKITRVDIDHRPGRKIGTHGWEVRFQSKVDKTRNIHQFFSDSKYGNKEKALTAAKIFRDAMEKEYKPARINSLESMMVSRNRSGYIGVHRTIKTETKTKTEYWQAHWPVANKKSVSRKFSIKRYGEEEALKLALEARENGILEYKKKFDVLFNPPDNPDIKVWRYLDFTKYVSLLVNKGIYFPRADKFHDQFEGSYSFANKKLRPIIYENLNVKYDQNKFRAVMKNFRKWIFINCWHINEFESAGMWNLYSKTEESICIQTTYQKLREGFDDDIKIGIVKYVDYENEWIPENNVLAPFLYKRKSFEHERELRVIINMSKKTKYAELETLDDQEKEGIWVNTNLRKMIEQVYVSPNSTDWFYELVKSVTDVYKLNIPVRLSSLDEEPFY